MRKSKKGVTLVFVIVVVLALLIFSAVIFSASAHSLDLTGKSVDDRQTYLTAKSAIEYARTIVYQQAKSGSLKDFAVKPGENGNQFAAETGSVTSDQFDGVHVYAACTSTGGNVKISAKVRDKNSDRYQKLSYTFTINWNSTLGLPASDFFACGVKYGSQQVFNCGFWPQMRYQGQTTTSIYPVVENLPLAGQPGGGTVLVTAPEILLMGDSNMQKWSVADEGHYSFVCENGITEIHSDRICINSDIFTACSSYIDWHQKEVVTSTAVVNLYASTQDATFGIIYFAGNNGGKCTIKRGTTADIDRQKIITIPKGFYQFQSGFDIGSVVAASADGSEYQDSVGRVMQKFSDATALQNFKQDIDYAESFFANYQMNILSGADWGNSKGADFERNGIFADNSTAPSISEGSHWYPKNNGEKSLVLDENAVFTYANSVGWAGLCQYPQYADAFGSKLAWDGQYNIYCAKQFFLQFVNSANNFTLPTYNVVFRSDLVSLNMMKTDTEEGTDANDRPKVVQANNAPGTKFILTSSSKDKNGNYQDVTLVVRHDIKVLYSNNAISYIIPTGVYRVQSGFNFFSKDKDDETKFKKISDNPSSGGSGDSGGSGGFTISGGTYSES